MTTATATDPRTAIPNEPPPGWEREVPKYRVIRDTLPAQKSRFRFEPPFASCLDNDVWQYGERLHKAGEVIATTEWPHGNFRPLNYSGAKVMEFFSNQMKSRMQRSPFSGGQIRLDNGLTGALSPQTTKPPQLQPMDLRPTS